MNVIYGEYIIKKNGAEIKKILLNDTSQLDALIITDIGFNLDFADIFPLFRKSMQKGCNIYWFDHHLIDKEIAKELIDLIELYYNDLQKCSAEIVKDFYLPNDNIARKIAKFAHDTDFGTNEYSKATQFQSIISYNRGKDGDENKKKIANLLSKGDFNNEWFSKQLEKLKNWEKTELRGVKKNREIIRMENFGEILISHANISAGTIAKFLKKEYPNKQVYLGIDQRYNELVVYSDNLNCRHLAIGFGGGGHKNRAGFKYENLLNNKNKVKKIFKDEFKSEIKNHIL